MQRIQDPTAVAAMPAVPTLAGTAGYFTGGNPTGGIPATVLRAWWLNMLQEELLSIVLAGGLMPNASGNQVLLALRAMIRGSRDLVTAAGAFTRTVPVWATACRARIQGAGGGSGGSYGASGTGGGGGGGGLADKLFTGLTPGSTLSGIIGAGGSAGAGGNGTATDGGNGATTSFNGVSATGGEGGKRYSHPTSPGAGGGGGIGIGGDLNLTGGQGGDGHASVPAATAFGGAAPFAGGFAKGGNSPAGSGNAGPSPGAGASASFSSTVPTVTGALGATGIVELEWLP